VAFETLFDKTRDVSSISYTQTRPLFKWVYAWMFIGLMVTAVVAMITASTPALIQLAVNPIVGILSFIMQIGIVVALSALIQRVSPGVAAALFIVYAASLGFTLSVIFLVFNLGSIAIAFGTTAILFGTMSMFGFTTDIDLSRYGRIFMFALFGLLIAMVINLLVGWSFLNFIISIVGVILFMGLTAYDTQNLKRLAAAPELQGNNELVAKYAVYGALGLYINFINIFIFLLQLMGGSSD
jgi:FtsH-binding integral membrane protein